MLNDNEAIARRGSVLDLADRQDQLTDLERMGFESAMGELQAYEKSALSQERVPYQVAPKLTKDNLTRYSQLLDGQEKADGSTEPQLLGEGFETPEMREQVVGAAYMATKFGVTEDEVMDSWPSFTKALQDSTGTDSFGSALRKDMEVTRGKMDLVDSAYGDAFQAATQAGASSSEAFQAFTKGMDEIPPELFEFYDSAFQEASQVYGDNQEQFSLFTEKLNKAIGMTGLTGGEDFFAAVNSLHEIDPAIRRLALTYAANNLEVETGALEAFNDRVATIFRQLSGASARDLIKARDFMMRSAGNPVAVSPGFNPDPQNTFERLKNLGQAAPAQLTMFPGWREANPIESEMLHQAAREAGEFAQTMVMVQEAMSTKILSADDIQNPFIRSLANKVIYPAAQMTADAAMFAGSMTLGKGSQIRGAGMAIAYVANRANLSGEHFRKLISENPEIDPTSAYQMSNVSGSFAASLDTLSMGLLVSRLPAVGKLMKNWRSSSFGSPVLAGLREGGKVLGAETLAEMAQDFSADLALEIFGAFDADLPDANLTKSLRETIKSAPDIALAVLPFALLGGGHASVMTRQAQQGLIQVVENGGLDLILDETQVNDILSKDSLGEKIKSLGKKLDLKELDKAIQTAQEKGLNLSLFLSRNPMALVPEDGQNLSFDEPTITRMTDPETGQDKWVYQDPEPVQIDDPAFAQPKPAAKQEPKPPAEPEIYDTQEEAISRAERWYEENGMADTLNPDHQAEVHKERPQSMEDDEVLGYRKATTSREILARDRINAPTIVDDSTSAAKPQVVTIGGKKVTLNPDSPVSSKEILDSLTAVLQVMGQGGAIRTGRIHPARRAAGFFHPKSEIIRIRTSNNLPTAAHEAGHALDHALFRPNGVKMHIWEKNKLIPKKVVQELRKLGHDLYYKWAGVKKEPHNKYGSEGFAEFFRLFITDPDQAKQKAPETMKFFLDVAATVPGLPDALTTAQLAGTTFFRQGSVARAQATIVKSKTATERLKEAVKQADLFRDFIDDSVAVQRYWEEALKRNPNLSESLNPALTLTSRKLTADAIVDHMAKHGMLNEQGQLVGRPLVDVFSLVQGKVDEFIVYLYAKRTMALLNDPNGARASGLDGKDAQTIIKEFDAEPNFALAAQYFYDWHNGVLDFVASHSESMQEAVDKIREIDPGFYLPLQREFESVANAVSGMGGGPVTGKNLVQKLKGSTRRIKDPVESSLANAKKMVLKAQNVKVIEQVIALAERVPGMGSLAVKADRDMIVSGKISIAEMMAGTEAMVRSYAQANGVDMDAWEQAFEEASEDVEGAMQVFFAPAVTPSTQNEAPIIPIYRQGKVQWWELDPELYKALKGMEHIKWGPVARYALQKPAQLFRIGTTGLNAAFSIISNPLRDFSTLHKNSQAQANTGALFIEWVQNTAALFLDAINVGSYRKEWLEFYDALGVKMAQPLNQDGLSLQQTAAVVKMGGKRFARETKWKTIQALPGNAIDVLKELFQFSEAAARLTEIKLLMKERGMDIHGPLTASDIDAIRLAGKQVTTDFTSGGRIARQINMAVPFFNAAIQGPRAHVRAAKRNPIKFAMRGMQASMAALVVWWFNKDEDWWQEMDEDERYLYTYIQVGDELIRIPRAFEADGLFMAGAEALADAWYRKEPEKAGRWFREWLSQLGPLDLTFSRGFAGTLDDVSPVLMSTFVELQSNRDFFFDSPIESFSDQFKDAEERFSPYTTTLSVELGRLLKVSPKKLDHAIRSVGGGVAIDIVALLGRGELFGEDPIDKDWEPSDLPVFGRLFQRGGQWARNPKSIDQFYDALGEAQRRQQSERVKETPEQAVERLRLTHAARMLSGLRQLGNRSKRREVRLAVEKEMVEVAKWGISGDNTRDAEAALVHQFTQQIEAQNKAEK